MGPLGEGRLWKQPAPLDSWLLLSGLNSEFWSEVLVGVKYPQFDLLLNKQNPQSLCARYLGKIYIVSPWRVYFGIIPIILTAIWNLDNWTLSKYKHVLTLKRITHLEGGGRRIRKNFKFILGYYRVRGQPGLPESPSHIKEEVQLLKLNVKPKGAGKASVSHHHKGQHSRAQHPEQRSGASGSAVATAV